MLNVSIADLDPRKRMVSVGHFPLVCASADFAKVTGIEYVMAEHLISRQPVFPNPASWLQHLSALRALGTEDADPELQGLYYSNYNPYTRAGDEIRFITNMPIYDVLEGIAGSGKTLMEEWSQQVALAAQILQKKNQENKGNISIVTPGSFATPAMVNGFSGDICNPEESDQDPVIADNLRDCLYNLNAQIIEDNIVCDAALKTEDMLPDSYPVYFTLQGGPRISYSSEVSQAIDLQSGCALFPNKRTGLGMAHVSVLRLYTSALLYSHLNK